MFSRRSSLPSSFKRTYGLSIAKLPNTVKILSLSKSPFYISFPATSFTVKPFADDIPS